jgi:hypothetical protein
VILMTESTVVGRSEWMRFFDDLTKDHEGQLISIERLDPTFGDLDEGERMPFAAVTSDPNEDLVTVVVGGKSARFPVELRHTIAHPTEVDLALLENSETVVRIVDADGAATLLRFFRAPALG